MYGRAPLNMGARCAGAPTAMLLARKGYRVLLVDRASFPSDVVNGYYLQQHAVARLKRWGLLDKLRNSNCPPLHCPHLRFRGLQPQWFSRLPPTTLARGTRRAGIVLDKILVDAAMQAGAELREEFFSRGAPVGWRTRHRRTQSYERRGQRLLSQLES